MATVEALLDDPNAFALAAPDVRKSTAAVAVSQARSGDRLVRSEIGADGSIMVYKKGEFRMPNGDLYVGETVDDKRHGRGSYTFVNGDAYVGEFSGGIYNGMGVLRKAPFKEGGRDCKGRMYQGQWLSGSRHGRGRYTDGFGNVYEGEFADDCFSGRGSMMYNDGRRYEGDWVKGQWHGEGVLVFANLESYTGGFLRGLYHGEGIYRYGTNNGSYNGGWLLGRKHGIGKRVFASGSEHEGEYKAGSAAGRGLYKSPLGDLYVGYFKDDRYHGDGTLITCTGDRYSGQFVMGTPCGVGRWEFERGGWYEGEFSAAVRTGVRFRVPPRAKKVDVEELPVPPKKKTAISEKEKAKALKPSNKSGKGIQGARPAPPPVRPEDKNKPISFTQKLLDMEFVRLKTGLMRRKLEDFFAPILVGSPEDRAYMAAGGSEQNRVVPLPDGKRQGKGVRVWSDGARYEGDWVQDEMHGFGVYVGHGPSGSRYEGAWHMGRRHGRGIESYGNSDGETYVCPFLNQHSGSAGRCIYDGEWQEGWFWGEGTFTCCDGRQYAGGWRKGKRHGKGRWVMLPAKLHYGTMFDEGGSVTLAAEAAGEFGAPVKFDDQFRVRVHEGMFAEGLRQGRGKAILNNGDSMEGVFAEGKPHGNIRYIFAASKKLSYAVYSFGERKAWISPGPALEALLAEDKKRAAEEEQAIKRKTKGVALMNKIDMFGEQKAALRAKVEVDKTKRLGDSS